MVVTGASSTVTSTSRDRLDAVSELGDAGPPEQPERGQPALALVDRRQAQRIARLELQLPLDRLGVGPLVADDQHVVDEDARPFLHGEDDVGACAVGAQSGLLATVALRKPSLA